MVIPFFRDCSCCEHCTPIGEGDHLCDARDETFVLCEYEPTEDYMWCRGKKFMSRYENKKERKKR